MTEDCREEYTTNILILLQIIRSLAILLEWWSFTKAVSYALLSPAAWMAPCGAKLYHQTPEIEAQSLKPWLDYSSDS